MPCVTALVLWPVLATAPWESSGISALLCEDALLRRRAVESALMREYNRDGLSFPLRQTYSRTYFYATEVETLQTELTERSREIAELCPE